VNTEDIIKELDELLEKKKSEDPVTKYKPYVFKEPGERFYGRILGTTTDRFERVRYIVLDLRTGNEYILPGHKALISQLSNQDAREGDYVVIEYLGQSSSGANRYFAVVKKTNGFKIEKKEETKAEQKLESKEEEEEIGKFLEDLDSEDKSEDVLFDSEEDSFKELEELEKEEVSENEKENSATDDMMEEAKKSVRNLFEFYDKIPKTEIEYYLNQVKKLNVDVDEVIKALGYKEVDGMVYK
jgi:hypothetical protein